MKSKEVLELLKVSRVTLSTYVRTGRIKATLMENGYYNYHDDSVYAFLGKKNRINVIYGRVSTYKQKKDLKKQIEKLYNYCSDNNIDIDRTFQDISSGIDLDRPHFSKLLSLVFEHKIDTIYITNKDRLTRLSYVTLKSIFSKFGTKIVVINATKQTDYNELFDDVTALMHYFASKEYSSRRKKLK